jgi:hypothetical protein
MVSLNICEGTLGGGEEASRPPLQKQMTTSTLVSSFSFSVDLTILTVKAILEYAFIMMMTMATGGVMIIFTVTS